MTVEFKHLQQNAPGGVYVVPATLRLWHGVIFLRRGMYASGIYRFRVELPEEYNEVDAWPRVFLEKNGDFHCYSPLVDADTGEVDLKKAYPRWDPTKHFVVTALTFLKKIFYLKESDLPKDANQAARDFKEDPPTFLRSVRECVERSQRHARDDDETRALRFQEHPLLKKLSRTLRDRGDTASPADFVIDFIARHNNDEECSDLSDDDDELSEESPPTTPNLRSARAV